MNNAQIKKVEVGIRVRDFGINQGPIVAGSLPGLAAKMTELNAILALIAPVAADIAERSHGYTAHKTRLKKECMSELWRLVSVMKAHFIITNNTKDANNLKICESLFYRLSESSFYNFSQVVMNMYDPAVYTVYGISEASIDALKATLKTFPTQMLITAEARLAKREAVIKLKTLMVELTRQIKIIDYLIRSIKDIHPVEHDIYFNLRPLGIVMPTHGKPHHQGQLLTQEVKPLPKHTYRRKLALIVKNTGNSPILAGMSLDGKEFTGTPFIIPPGKTMQRISQKLAPAGEFFMLQNMGEGESSYKVWVKE